MEKTYNIAASKYLSYILRHNPASGNIVLSEDGWAQIEDIIKGSKNPITQEDIFAAVEHNSKKRFELCEDRLKIRAVQGHSVPVKIEMDSFVPSGPVYHGTNTKVVDIILKEGLHPQTRHHVHLSKDVETATDVGKRKGTPVILEIDAMRMRAEGFKLMVAKNGVILADSVPAKYIKKFKNEKREVKR